MPTQDINALFSAGISKHLEIEMKERAPVYPMLFHMESSDSKYEDLQNWENYALPVRKSPGLPAVMGEARQSYGKRFVHETYALGDVIPDEDWEDDKYGVLSRLLPTKGGGMARAFRTLMEVQHFGMFSNLGFVATLSTKIAADGVGLFSASHPLSAGNAATLVANRPSTDVDLSISSYQAAATNLRTQYAANGVEYTDNEPSRLVTHPSLRYIAKQILKGDWERDTANRNTNYIVDDKVEQIDSPYFKSSGATGTNNSWFVEGREHYLWSFLRSAYNVDTDHDIYVQARVFVATCRFSYGWSDFRGVYGSKGA